MTNEQIEQKKQQLQQLAEQAKTIVEELKEAGSLPLDEDDLDDVAGGWKRSKNTGASFRPWMYVPLIGGDD